MKCIKPTEQGLENGAKLSRVKDERAAELVESGDYVYCPKSEWKEAGRP